MAVAVSKYHNKVKDEGIFLTPSKICQKGSSSPPGGKKKAVKSFEITNI